MIDWNQIETVFLDMDGTLLDLHYDNHFWLTHLPQRFAEHRDIPLEDSRAYLQRIYEVHAHTLNWYCIDFWSDALQMDIAGLKHEVTDRIGWRPNARRLLEFIRDRGLDVALVTNAHQKSIEVKLLHTDLGQMITEIISSHELRLPKEDPQFWRNLHQQRHFNPERTVFFDDNEKVLRAARTFGIRHLYGIAQPDSARAKCAQGEFPLIHDFQDLLA
jgi:putative hydrolase of the HAD superfamily